MDEKDFHNYMLQSVEKVRERLHVVENSLASTSAAMLTFNKNMSEVIDLQKKQSEELSQLKNTIENIHKINIKDVIKNPTTLFCIGFVVYLLERSGFWKTFEHWLGIGS